MSVCPTDPVLRFYGCCHPCFFSIASVCESFLLDKVSCVNIFVYFVLQNFINSAKDRETRTIMTISSVATVFFCEIQ